MADGIDAGRSPDAALLLVSAPVGFAYAEEVRETPIRRLELITSTTLRKVPVKTSTRSSNTVMLNNATRAMGPTVGNFCRDLHATGQQSQWVITHLLAASMKVHAVVRNVQKVPAILESPGVTLFEGESTNYEVILQAAQGCKAAFLNTFPIPGLEAQQAKTIVAACKEAGVETLVAATTFATGDRAFWDDEKTDECQLLEYFASKAEVEDIVRRADFKAYTILRPAILHQDFLLPGAHQNYPMLPQGELDHAFNEGVKAPFTDAQDVGQYAAAAMRNPDQFAGQEIDLGTEALTIKEAHDILTKVSGRKVRLRQRTPEEQEEAKASIFGQRFQLLANVKDFGAQVTAAKKVEVRFGIPFTPLRASLLRDKARLLECLPA